jgi:hypothetical protein
VTNGIVSAANFSPDGSGGGGDAGAAIVGATDGVETGVGVGTEGAAGEGIVTGGLAAETSFRAPRISILVKYRNPPTPMATRHTTVTTKGTPETL